MAFEGGLRILPGVVLVEDGHVVGGHGVLFFLSFLVWWCGALVRCCCLRARGCAPVRGECGVCVVASGSVVAAQRGGGCCVWFSVYHGEGCVYLVVVMVVVVLRIFDVGVHDAGCVVSAFVGVFEVVPSVRAFARPM